MTGERLQLSDHLLFDFGTQTTAESAFEGELSFEAEAAIDKIYTRGEDQYFFPIACALNIVLYKLIGQTTVSIDFGEKARLINKIDPNLTISILIRELRILPSEESISDVLIRILPAHEPVTVKSSHNLIVSISQGASGTKNAIRLEGRRIPKWFLHDIFNDIDTILSQFMDLTKTIEEVCCKLDSKTLAKNNLFNQSECDFFTPYDAVTLLDRIVLSHPNSVAVISKQEQITYTQLATRSSQLANQLVSSFSIVAGDVVGCLMDASINSIVSLFGVLRAGGCYLPLNPDLPASKIAGMLTQGAARLLLIQSEDLAHAAGTYRIPILPIDRQFNIGLPTLCYETLPDPERPAYCVFTSGSTGIPKGVKISHAGICNVALDQIDRFNMTTEDAYLQFMSPSFDGSFFGIFTTLISGAKLVLLEERDKANPKHVVEHMNRNCVTITTMTPSYIRLIDFLKIRSLRILVSAGEPADAETFNRYSSHFSIYNAYGPTEAAIISNIYKADPSFVYNIVPVGRPTANKKIYIIDSAMNLVPPGIIGEVCISGKGVAHGYINNDVESRERFIPNPFEKEQMLYRSGDFGSWTPEGNLLVRGRLDDQVKINGYRIDPHEISETLSSHPLVSHAFTKVVHTAFGKSLVAYYKSNPEKESLKPTHGELGKFDEESINKYLASKLAHYLIPSQIIEVESWPMTPHGKLDVNKLAGLVSHHQNQKDNYAAPRSDFERTMCKIWQDLLEHAPIGIDDDFYGCGGDSIRIIQCAHMAETYGYIFDPADMMDHSTIRQLSQFLEKSENENKFQTVSVHEKNAMAVHSAKPYPATFMQTWMIRKYLEDINNEGIYHCAVIWNFKEVGVNSSRLSQALQTVINRQPSLRKHFFRSSEGKTLQIVRETSEIPILISSIPEDLTLAAFFQREIDADKKIRFDAYDDSKPLVRFHIYTHSMNSHYILITFHHAIMDGWSGIELKKEIIEAYSDYNIGAIVSSDPQKEFSEIISKAQQSTESMAFWNSQEIALLDRMPVEIALPTYQILHLEFATSSIDSAQRAAKRLNVSMKAIMLAALATALFEVFRQEKVSIGVVTNGRSTKLSNPLGSIGFFWSIIPILIDRHQITPKQVQSDIFKGERHTHYIHSDLFVSRCDLIPCFNFINFHNETDESLKLVSEQTMNDRFHFPINFLAALTEDGIESSLKIRADYRNDYLSEAKMHQLLAEWEAAINDLT